MASGWADGLPRANVPRGTPKGLTLIVPYYDQPTFLAKQIAHWSMYSADVRDRLMVIVVDDGSPTSPAERVCEAHRPVGRYRLFRITVDVPWNWLAARNIGAHHAENGWLLLTDLDHVVPEETMESVMAGQHDPALVYAFSRREHTGVTVSPHSASFLMTRNMFWRIGGYDERLSGVYGTDGLYRRRLLRTAPVRVLPDVLIRHEFVDDASVSLPRKTPEMTAARSARLATIAAGSSPTVLSFPYREVPR